MLALFDAVVRAVGAALAEQTDWALAAEGAHGAQYEHDRSADRAALEVLAGAGVAVLSEESGHRGVAGSAVTVVVDPIDGSTNASRRLPWWSTALCAVDVEGPWVGLVHDHVSGTRYWAVRGHGAYKAVIDARSDRGAAIDGTAVRRPPTPALAGAVVSLAGWPPRHGGWAQFRAYGSLALELCAVAEGALDGHVQFVCDEVAPWDYLAGALVCAEAGGCVVDAFGRDLTTLDHATRRTPVGAGSAALLDELVAMRRSLPPRP